MIGNEITIIREMCALRTGVLALRYPAITIATLLSAITLVLTEEALTPLNVFILISFNKILGTFICSYLGPALLEGFEAYVSLGRIEEFLLLKNLRVISTDRSNQKETEIEMRNSTEMKRYSVDRQQKLGDFWIVNEVQDQTTFNDRSLPTPQEDCEIGVISSKLYLKYFGSAGNVYLDDCGNNSFLHNSSR